MSRDVPPGRIVLGPDIDGVVVAIEGDRIAEVSAAGDGARPRAPGGDPAEAGRRDSLVLSCPNARLEPGQVDAHTHIYSALAPLGLPRPEREPANFVEILEGIWWRLDRALDAPALRACARLYAAEALLAGTTCLIDHHESPAFIEGSLDVLAEACEEMGIRALLCYGATERNAGRAEARRGLAECRRFHDAHRGPLVRGVVGLHASFTISDDTAREAGELARALGIVTHVHLAEDGADVEDAQRRGWPGPLQRLLALEALPQGSILAHGIHLTVDEVRAAEEHGLWFVQNPRSNRGNRVGYPRALAASGRVALGTDGYPARMHEEIEALEHEASRHGDDETAMRRRPGAGRALAAARFGVAFTLTAGAAADVVARVGNEARHVVAGGRLVVRDGRLVAADVAAIRREAAAAAPPLWARMAAL